MSKKVKEPVQEEQVLPIVKKVETIEATTEQNNVVEEEVEIVFPTIETEEIPPIVIHSTENHQY